MTVLDIGANIGAHTLRLGKLVAPDGRVLAFEPTDYAFQKLLRNVKLNPHISRNICCFQYFLTTDSDLDVPESIYSSWPLIDGRDLHPVHRGEPKSTSGARCAPLDKLLVDVSINKVDLLKLDVDGFECDVLAGATTMLRRDTPILITELAPYIHAERGKSFDDFVEMLQSFGYSFYDQHTGRPLPRGAREIATQIGARSSKNVIARVTSTGQAG
jgi:FkbM family methyltransferase